MAVFTYLTLFMMATTWLLCSCTKIDDERVCWQPVIQNDGWKISGAGMQDIDSVSVDHFYKDASELDNLYSFWLLKTVSW